MKSVALPISRHKQLIIGFFIGITMSVLAVILALILMMSILPRWKSHWFLEIVRLLPRRENVDHGTPQIVFSSPSSWITKQSHSSPLSYHSEREIKSDSNPSTSLSLSHVYTDELKVLAGSKTLVEQRLDYFENELSKMKALRKGQSSEYAHLIIRYLVGYLPSVAPSFEIADATTEYIWLKGRYGAKFRSLTLHNNSPKGVVIAIHGQGGSPEGVIGKVNDYANAFGKYWYEFGYDVIAPDVKSIPTGVNFPRLGLTEIGADLALIFDLIKYTKQYYNKEIPIIVAGISYGSQLAELIGVLSDDADAIISIGGAARYCYICSKWSLPAVTPSHAHYLNSFLDIGGIYDLILPKKIVISVGNHDNRNWGREGENKIFVLNEFEKRNVKNKNKYRINLFLGTHEADPKEEIKLYEQLVKYEQLVNSE